MLMGALLPACRTADMDGSGRASTYRPEEPNYLAWNGEPGIDDQVDVRLTFLAPWTRRFALDSKWAESVQLHAVLTGRVSQVLRSQDSAPLLGRRFNPELFLRFWGGSENPETTDYLDFAIGHESNGESINSGAELLNKQAALMDDGDDPDAARRSISRSWDYAGLTYRRTLDTENERFAYLRTRFFFKNGLFGESEDYFGFEGSDEVQSRSRYDGLTFIYRDENLLGGDSNFRGLYTTGYEDLFDNSTFRIEWTHDSDTWPLTVFAQTGYNNDFATYYTHTSSVGIGVELR